MHHRSPCVGEVYLAICEEVNSPISLGAWLRFKYDQKSLSEMEFPIRDYTESERFRKDYLVVSYLSKYKHLSTGVDLEAAALQKFESSEVQCREANVRIRSARYGRLNNVPSSELFTAKRKIADLLGPYSAFLLEHGVGWGPGATDDLRRREAALDTKIHKVPISVTRDAKPLIEQMIREDIHWSAAILRVEQGAIEGPFSFVNVFQETEYCVIDLVPKNAKTHRVIAKEPRANAFLQKGFGAYFRKRLKRVGIDLDNQEANQRGAYRSYFDELSTLDLKAASDSMSIELVYELLPVDWAMALDECRSKWAKLPSGKVIRLEKFSSMGNGFTFELESLLFWALASSVKETLSAGGEVLVYGDDLIVSRTIAKEVINLLSFVGFTTNEDKTFIDGNFFESCGRHYFQGVDVTPVYQKEALDSLSEQIRAGNRLIRYAFQHRVSRLDSTVRRSWAYLVKHSLSFEPQIPLGVEGDDGWLVPATHFSPVGQDLNLGLRCKVVARSVRRFPAHEPSLLSWTLRRGVLRVHHPWDNDNPSYEGFIEFPPEESAPLEKRRRWVMPSGDFGYSW